MRIKKKHYLWFNNNIKTHNTMRTFYLILAALSLLALPFSIYLFADNALNGNIEKAFLYLLLFMAAALAAGTALGSIDQENE